jgi:hypothetical protein
MLEQIGEVYIVVRYAPKENESHLEAKIVLACDSMEAAMECAGDILIGDRAAQIKPVALYRKLGAKDANS